MYKEKFHKLNKNRVLVSDNSFDNVFLRCYKTLNHHENATHTYIPVESTITLPGVKALQSFYDQSV